MNHPFRDPEKIDATEVKLAEIREAAETKRAEIAQREATKRETAAKKEEERTKRVAGHGPFSPFVTALCAFSIVTILVGFFGSIAWCNHSDNQASVVRAQYGQECVAGTKILAKSGGSDYKCPGGYTVSTPMNDSEQHIRVDCYCSGNGRPAPSATTSASNPAESAK